MIDVVETLSSLVSIPSVNPMGRGAEGPHYYEAGMTTRLVQLFEQMGVPCQTQEVHPNRSNVYALLEGETPLDQGGVLMLWEAHQDTVPVEGMTIEPWTPTIRDGRLYGRGSCDIKGGMASMLAAFSRLVEDRPANRPHLVMACTVNEEHGYTGATALADLWHDPAQVDHPLRRFLPRAPDGIIVAEPTELNVVSAHKGVARWRCRAKGRAAHSSSPSAGDNAIYRMARVLGILQKHAEQDVPRLGSHPLVGTPTLSVGVISGGISVNTVPAECVIEIDRRVLPGESAPEARQQVIDHLTAALGDDALHVEHDAPFIMSGGLSDEDNGDLATRLAAIAKDYGGGKIIGVPFGTDASAYSAANARSVVFGPGSIAQAHTCDEWIDIQQLQQAAEILYQFGSAS
ncbi:M20 family metallopeptidase [Lignipirellula cremea]|uniref:Acetylornithine deacetylase n=1 Tax=Lignipirellula cremea TaxID=2528010 RepID=A0A518DSL3_9BACT|nr:M20 family metallopeptidase [Lignipirellula cremea]QDU94814.1 Acetylornithine deacetylase [Lignipirellula cremea]